MILLVVDTQKLITNEKLYNFDTLKSNIKSLIETARNNSIEVIYVRHDDGKDTEMTVGTDGFEIYDEFAPLDGERIFDKTANSAFKDTGLTEYLKEKGENTIIIVGLQTEYCIDATIKAGFEHGFKMIVPANSNSTFSNKHLSAKATYEYYNNFIWNKRYATCLSYEATVKLLENKLRTVAVSACLIGENCKYNADNNRNEKLVEWLKDKKVISVCPEVLGGLPIPRLSAQIVNGTVTNILGECVHKEFTKGAKIACSILDKEDIDLVILQSRSPSCGVKEIYDGTFSRTLIKGQGIFAKLITKRGYNVMDIEDFDIENMPF